VTKLWDEDTFKDDKIGFVEIKIDELIKNRFGTNDFEVLKHKDKK